MKIWLNMAVSAMATVVLATGALAAAPEIELVPVKGGCFQMGDTFGGGGEDERPVHTVCVNDFLIGKFEVTQAQWKAIVKKNPSGFKGDRLPVENVSWNDVQGFIKKLNARTGKKYRLPTEAEWEYAARSGGKEEKFAGTSKDEELAEYALIDRNSQETTSEVGIRRPNGLGIHDLSGNVWEWVQDIYGATYYEQPGIQVNPKGQKVGEDRVRRGGGWTSSPRAVRTSYRYADFPDSRNKFVGFRLALSAD